MAAAKLGPSARRQSRCFTIGLFALLAIAVSVMGLVACTGGSAGSGSRQPADTTAPLTRGDGSASSTAAHTTDPEGAPASTPSDYVPTNFQVNFQYTDPDGWHYSYALQVEQRVLTITKDLSDSPPGKSRLAYAVSGGATDRILVPDDNDGRPNGPQLIVDQGADFPYTANVPEGEDNYAAGNHSADDSCQMKISHVYGSTDYAPVGAFTCSLPYAGQSIASYDEYDETVVDNLVSVGKAGLQGVTIVHLTATQDCWFKVDVAARKASLATIADYTVNGQADTDAFATYSKTCKVAGLTVTSA